MSSTGMRYLFGLVLGSLLLACAAPAPTAEAPRAAAPAAGAAAAPAVPVPAPSEPVTISASQNVTSNLIPWLAQEAGLFARNGVSVDLQNINAQVATKAFVAGQLQGIWVGGSEVLGARAAGTPITIVAVFVPVYNQLMLAPPPAASVADLRGKNVGIITYNSINGVGTIAALRQFGLEPGRDYQVVETGSAGVYQGLAAQLMARNVDAAALPPDLARKVVPEGFGELFDQVTLSTPAVSASLAFHHDVLRQQPATVQKIVDTLVEGVRYARGHRAETQEVLRKYFRVTDQAELDLVYDRLVGQVFAREPYPAVEQFPDTVEAMAREFPEVRNVDLASLIDRRFVDDAVRRGLTQY
jgi:ABC-type nitrate/sulfonate/bicarbonate transport system substrate-binding protein